MRGPNEKIELDAYVEFVISLRVFAVKLENGHRLVAVAGSVGDLPMVGDKVRISLCPGDMSRGRIVAGGLFS